MLITDSVDPEDTDMDHVKARLTRLLRKQEPLDTYFDRLSIDPQGKSKAKGQLKHKIVIGCHPRNHPRPLGLNR